MKIVVCALTSSDSVRLARLIQSVKMNQAHGFDVTGLVVCNTLSETYPAEAKAVADDAGWDFIQTESNGKPGKGKNSVFKVFNEEYPSHDYLLMMDGDDFLYDTALRILHRMVLTAPKLDALGLQTNDIIDTRVYPGYGGVALHHEGKVINLYSWFEKQQNLYAMPEHFNKVVRTNRLGEHSTPDRLILFSHAATKLLYCSETLPVYEDYILSLSAQVFHLKGAINYFNTANTCIYVYDKTNESSTCKVYDKAAKGDWGMHEEQFKADIAPLEPRLGNFHASEVPFLCSAVTNLSMENKSGQILRLLSMFPSKIV